MSAELAEAIRWLELPFKEQMAEVFAQSGPRIQDKEAFYNDKQSKSRAIVLARAKELLAKQKLEPLAAAPGGLPDEVVAAIETAIENHQKFEAIAWQNDDAALSDKLAVSIRVLQNYLAKPSALRRAGGVEVTDEMCARGLHFAHEHKLGLTGQDVVDLIAAALGGPT